MSAHTKAVFLIYISNLVHYVYSQQNFVYNPMLLTMSDADASCAFSYGSLASIQNEKENTDAFNQCLNTNNTCWIGLNNIDNPSLWQWTDGSTSDYAFNVFNSSNFNKTTNKSCVILGSDLIHWNQVECNAQFPSLCNYPSSTIIAQDNANNIRNADALSIGTMDILDEVSIVFDYIVYSFSSDQQYTDIFHIGNDVSSKYPTLYLDNVAHKAYFEFSTVLYSRFSGPNANWIQTLDVWYTFELYITQDRITWYVNDAGALKFQSHSIATNQQIYIGQHIPNITESFHGKIRGLTITANNAYSSPFNYLCDYANRFTVIRGVWTLRGSCWLYQDDPIGSNNIVWIGDVETPSKSWTDYKIESIVHLMNGSSAGILVRAQSVNLAYYVDINIDKGIGFCHIDGGLGSDPICILYYTKEKIGFAEDYTIRFEVISDKMNIYLADKHIIELTDNFSDFGSVGFQTLQSAAIFKNVRIMFPNHHNWISFEPTKAPTKSTQHPTNDPTYYPSLLPSQYPTNYTQYPTLLPSKYLKDGQVNSQHSYTTLDKTIRNNERKDVIQLWIVLALIVVSVFVIVTVYVVIGVCFKKKKDGIANEANIKSVEYKVENSEQKVTVTNKPHNTLIMEMAKSKLFIEQSNGNMMGEVEVKEGGRQSQDMTGTKQCRKHDVYDYGDEGYDFDMDYRSWNATQIVYWIIHLDSGKFGEYEDILQAILDEEQMSGHCLRNIDSTDICGWGISNSDHIQELLKHIQTLVGYKETDQERYKNTVGYL